MIQNVVECQIAPIQKIVRGIDDDGNNLVDCDDPHVNMSVETLKVIVKMGPMMMEMVPLIVMMMTVVGLLHVVVLESTVTTVSTTMVMVL